MVKVSPFSRRLIVAALALLAAAMLSWFAQGALQRLDERSTDRIWSATASTDSDRRLIVIDIDDQSLAALGPWPWKPQLLAQLVDQLRSHGAGLILFDATFPQDREGTAQFARALAAGDQKTPAVLGQLFALRNETRLHMGEPTGAWGTQGCHPASAAAQGTIANAKGLHTRAGHITPIIDVDGSVRRVPAFVCYAGRQYPALSLMPFLAADPGQLQPGHNWWEPAWTMNWPQMGMHPVGLDTQGNIRVPYKQARGAYTALSASDIIQNRVPQGVLQGAWVIVGASAFGLSDAIPTALGPAVSGVEVHAQLISAILDGVVPHTPQAAPWLQVGYIALCAALLVWLANAPPLSTERRVVLVPVMSLGLVALAYLLHAVVLLKLNWYIGWSTPALATLVLGGTLGVYEHANSQHVKGRLFQNLASYVSGPVARSIALHQPSGEIQAQRADITVVAVDVRNFSAYCEARPPEDAARVLHRIYKTASHIVAEHGGVVEEMVGDSLLAVFNGPMPCENHPVKALQAALDIWTRCGEELPNTSGRGLEPLAISVGVESGMALVGSFGDSDRRVHTVLGQTVTVAIRLCEMTADLSYPVLVGQGAAGHLPTPFGQPEIALKPLGNFLLPGLKQGTKIYTLKHLLEPYGALEQDNLAYIKQQQNAA